MSTIAGDTVTGVPGSPGVPGSVGDPLDCGTAPIDTGAGVLRRLSNLEYQLTLQDLFALGAPPELSGIPADISRDGFSTFAAEQTISAQHLRGYRDLATTLADALLLDDLRLQTVVGCDLAADGCLETFVGTFGMQAFRRPLEATETSAVAARARENALDTPDQFRAAIEILLTSPSFLFRVEVGDSSQALTTLGPYELAARLSFAAWGRAPSVQLLQQAAAGDLDTAAGLETVAGELLADPRAQQFFQTFFRQWLGYELLRAPQTPPADWSDALLQAMQQETDSVVSRFAWQGGDLLQMLTTDETQISPELAAFQGLPVPEPNGLLSIPATHVRAGTGILTHASILSAKTDGDLIAIRGNALRETFLCRSLAPPPGLAELIGDLLEGLTRTEIVQERNARAECRTCHALIDPIGVGFAAFDGTGRFDPSIDIADYGVTPALPDATDPGFDSLAELALKLQQQPEVAECLTERAFLYVNGREPLVEDSCTVQSAAGAFVGEGNQFQTLLRSLIEAPAFRLRRTPLPAL